jgi:glycosyltransferase involved in cell wall biosynthesis
MRGRANIPNSFIKEKPYKIRLLAISHDAYRAGSQIILLNFLRWIREREYAEVGVLLRAGGALEREFEKVGSVWKLSPEAQRKSFRGWFSSGARQVAPLNKLADVLTSEYRPDVIYANTVMNGAALPYLRSLNAPIITHVHELDMWMRQSMSREQFAVVDRNTDLFVVVSDAAKRNLIDNWGVRESKIRLIYGFVPNIVNPERTETDLRWERRHALGIPDDAVVVGGCGTTDWRKGPDLFIQAAKYVLGRNTAREIHFVWLGGEDAGTRYEMLRHDVRQAGLDSRVKFLGECEDSRPFFATIDLLALTSREDPFPLVVLEAAMFAKPAVCFNGAGGIPEFVDRGCGRSVPYLDVWQFAEAIVELIESPALRERLGQAARQRVTRLHSLDVGGMALWKVLSSMARAS